MYTTESSILVLEMSFQTLLSADGRPGIDLATDRDAHLTSTGGQQIGIVSSSTAQISVAVSLSHGSVARNWGKGD